MTAIATLIVLILWLPFKGVSLAVSNKSTDSEKVLGALIMVIGFIVWYAVGIR